jgi:murein DD-endopeptidase MepM/ murein hydrolase activator NlpD
LQETIVGRVDQPEQFKIRYLDNGEPDRRAFLASLWKHFNRNDPATGETYKLYTRPTDPERGVVVDHIPPSGYQAGQYRLEVFVPGKYASTRKASFTVLHGERSESGLDVIRESRAFLDMSEYADVWRPLGIFDLDPGLHAEMGRIRQYDFSLEDPVKQISFGPVRWVPYQRVSGAGLRYDSPVGTEVQRQGIIPVGGYHYAKYPYWVGEWFDYNLFLEWYIYGYHTGADLNLPGSSASDRGEPVYAVSEGLVTYAGKAGTWGNIIVIEHPEGLVTHPDGKIKKQMVYSRYGHLEDNLLVKTGEIVSRGMQIGSIGLPFGWTSGWHLHFDISYSDVLKNLPAHWPDISTILRIRSAERRGDTRKYSASKAAIKREVLKHYVDPLNFLRDNHMAGQ